MNLASPWALSLAALAVPLVAAYLYRRHDARRTVPSAILLRAILDPRPPSRRARAQLRHRASLALIALALAAGILALAGPGAGSTRATRTVIVLDRSASMATHDRDGERLARA
ncbi:MAG: BatA domain-containing protein, partial [Kofleriaceae bacterium]